MYQIAPNLYVWHPGMNYCGACGAKVHPLMAHYWTCRRGHHFVDPAVLS